MVDAQRVSCLLSEGVLCGWRFGSKDSVRDAVRGGAGGRIGSRGEGQPFFIICAYYDYLHSGILGHSTGQAINTPEYRTVSTASAVIATDSTKQVRAATSSVRVSRRRSVEATRTTTSTALLVRV